MQKNKRPVSTVSTARSESSSEHEDGLAHRLAMLAADLAAREDRVANREELDTAEAECVRVIRKCLHQKKDDVLHEALDYALDEDVDAYRLLKERIEDAAENVVFRREDGPELEVNAFVVPLFARTLGGLRADQCFQDEEAFDLLRESFLQAQLESPDAKLVLVSHAYHPDELGRIGYSQVQAMVREAYEAMTRKKAPAAPAIGQSMSGWPESHFGPEDVAVELRYLLGFTLKRMDDRFYQVPKNEAAADAYFEKRAARFRQWATDIVPVVKRCLVTDGREIDLDFLYQDLFHGGKERGIAEYETLQWMADLHHELEAHGTDPESVCAVVGPADVEGETVLRVNLHAATGGALISSSDRPLALAGDLASEMDDACDALMSMGLKSLDVAKRFDAEGNPVDVRARHGQQGNR